MERELARARALLALEEQRNAALPPQIADRERRRARPPFQRRRHRVHGVPPRPRHPDVKDYMEPALRARIGRFSPGPREFFTEVDYRDPEVMRTHGYHWFDKGWMAHDPHVEPDPPRGPLLYNIFNTRTEGHATGWEEMMMQAGMFDARPRSRELIYILVAAARRAGARRLFDARQPMTLEQAAAFASRQHAARLAAHGRQPRPRRAAPLPAAAGLRHELS